MYKSLVLSFDTRSNSSFVSFLPCTTEFQWNGYFCACDCNFRAGTRNEDKHEAPGDVHLCAAAVCARLLRGEALELGEEPPGRSTAGNCGLLCAALLSPRSFQPR
eukprot:1160291-Pelagomonas_calceolata.AAC.14